MSKIGMILIIIGVACLWCAASNDNYYEAIGDHYSLMSLILWSVIGLASIIAGCKMSKLI